MTVSVLFFFVVVDPVTDKLCLLVCQFFEIKEGRIYTKAYWWEGAVMGLKKLFGE